jgi:hypothetical protein
MHERILQCSSESGYKHLSLRIVTKRRSDSPNQDTSVRPDGGFWVVLHASELTKEIVIQDTVVKLDQSQGLVDSTT